MIDDICDIFEDLEDIFCPDEGDEEAEECYCDEDGCYCEIDEDVD